MSENLIAMVFTDLVNSTAIKKHLEGSDITARNRIYRDTILMPHRQRVEASLAAYSGRKVETIGDAFFLVFPNPILAVEWAIAIQISHASDRIPTPLGALQLTIGMHTGCPLADGDNFIGQEVDYAARVAALASAGQILVSEVTAACVRDAHIAGLALHSHGKRDLKGIGEKQIFELLYNNKQPQPFKESKQIKFGGIGSVIDWRGNCRNLLADRQRLTTNPLMAGDGLGFELDEIYVPLGLVERKQQRRYSGDVSPERGSQLYEPDTSEEISQTFQQDEFFEQVLQSQKSKRIAIVGEPGAGKTTLLQKIAAWILDCTEDIPIWISLADLQGKSLEQYLLQDWLKAVTKKVRITPEMEDALGELFNSGGVWLLLDAVDEMAIESGNALALIANQLTGWIADARVVLTCRLNVWDAGKNALEAFDTYRNLDFSYGDAQTPDRVGQFIRSWFKSDPELGDRLRSELDRSGRERIKDAVKNPLRLALLCRTWARQQGELPNTKAGLYQQFIEALYDWKQDRFPTNSNQRNKLNKALGELALKAISEEKSKFRLRHRFVCEVLGEPDRELFQLALQLGFLNQVGVAAETENRGEKVYAFYHPTFQEYFAALAVDDWHYFLNHVPHNPSGGNYRTFEPQWKQVILLWLGRENVPKEQKEEFIKTLLEFKDGCGIENFYGVRAYFLAAAGIAEFRECNLADRIVTQLVKWGFGINKIEKQERWPFTFGGGNIIVEDPLKEVARAALQETDRSRTIAELLDSIDTTEHKPTVWQAARLLGQIEPGNKYAIAVLIKLLQTAEDRATSYKTAQILTKIGVGNGEACAALIHLLQTCEDESKRFRFAWNLGLIDPENKEAIATLIDLLHNNQDEFMRWQAARALGQIQPGHKDAIATLVHLLHTSESENIRAISARKLGQIEPGNKDAIAELIDLLHTSSDDYIRWQAAESLGEIGTGNPDAIATLIELTYTTGAREIHYRSALGLGQIGIGSPQARTALIHLLHTTKDELIRCQAAESLEKIDPGNSEAIEALTELLHTSQNEYIIGNAAQRLAKIDPGNRDAESALVNLLLTSQRTEIPNQAADCLKAFLDNKRFPIIVSSLKDYLQNENHFRYAACYKVLWHCAQNMTYPAFYQAWHNQPTSTHPEVPETTGVGSNFITQNLNLAELPSLLAAAIAKDSHLKENIKLICIDVGKFIDLDNPAAEIYIEMVEQGCRERQQGEPTTMQALKIYWKLLKSDRKIVLVFYEKSTGSQAQGFSHSFLTALGKFDGAIGVVTSPPTPLLQGEASKGEGSKSGSTFSLQGEGFGDWGCLQFFSPSQPKLVEDMVGWIRAIALENC